MLKTVILTFFITFSVFAAKISTFTVNFSPKREVLINVIEISQNDILKAEIIENLDKSTDLRAKDYRLSDNQIVINGGYFDEKFAPVGLLKSDGKWIQKTPDRKLSGLICFNEKFPNFFIKNIPKKEYKNIMQSGPFIIDPGGKIGIYSDNKKYSRRMALGKLKNGNLVIVTSEKLSLFELAKSVKKHLPNIDLLLNLDGGPSTGISMKDLDQPNNWPVRTYLRFTLR